MGNSIVAPEVLKRECESVISDLDTVEPERPCQAHGVLTRALKVLLSVAVVTIERDQAAAKFARSHAAVLVRDLIRLAIVGAAAAFVAYLLK